MFEVFLLVPALIARHIEYGLTPWFQANCISDIQRIVRLLSRPRSRSSEGFVNFCVCLSCFRRWRRELRTWRPSTRTWRKKWLISCRSTAGSTTCPESKAFRPSTRLSTVCIWIYHQKLRLYIFYASIDGLFVLRSICAFLHHCVSVLAGHYTSYGTKFPVPDKRRKRLYQEYAEIEKNIKKQRWTLRVGSGLFVR